jgi:2-C-methyl-D-erythritol 2,4-cyclodiphosphate synthase
MNIRVGQGFDVHQFAEGRPLIIGGIEIPYHVGLLGIQMPMYCCIRFLMLY